MLKYPTLMEHLEYLNQDRKIVWCCYQIEQFRGKPLPDGSVFLDEFLDRLTSIKHLINSEEEREKYDELYTELMNVWLTTKTGII